jgi:hypothetical protein
VSETTSVHEHIVATVIGLCHQRGFLVHACYSARWCTGKGFPDLCIIGKTGCIFAEVKVSTWDKPKAEQCTWGHQLLAAGAFYVVWTLKDLESGAIARSLDELK